MDGVKTTVILINNGDGSYDYDVNGDPVAAIEMMVDLLADITVREAEDNRVTDLVQDIVEGYARGVLEEMGVEDNE